MHSTLPSTEAGSGMIAGQPVAIVKPLPRLCPGKEKVVRKGRCVLAGTQVIVTVSGAFKDQASLVAV